MNFFICICKIMCKPIGNFAENLNLGNRFRPPPPAFHFIESLYHRYALRRLSRFVSLEFTKNVRCAVLLIRYAVPPKPHNQHVRACHKTVTEIAEAYENVTVAEIDWSQKWQFQRSEIFRRVRCVKTAKIRRFLIKMAWF